MSQGGEFAKLITEFGSSKEEEEKQAESEADVIDVRSKTDGEAEREMEKMKKAVAGDALMQAEERNTGAVSWEVYKNYLKAGKGHIILPLLLLSLLLFQAATVVSSYWYVNCLTVVTASTNERI